MQQTKVIFVCFAILAVCVSSASADLIVNLRAISVTGAGNTITGEGKTVNLASPGTITYGVYVKPDGLDLLNNEGLLALGGKFITTYGTGVLGNATGSALDPLFNQTANGAQAGTIQDLNADGRMDIGGTADTSATGWIYPLSTTYPAHRPTPSFEEEFYVDTIEYNAQVILPGGTDSSANWFRRNGSSAASNASWTEDGLPKTAAKNGTTYRSGDPVALHAIPEPSALILLSMGALALLAFRRRK